MPEGYFGHFFEIEVYQQTNHDEKNAFGYTTYDIIRICLVQ